MQERQGAGTMRVNVNRPDQ